MGEHGIREEKKGMNKGLKIGIIVGAVVLAAAAAALGGFSWYANKTVTEYDAIYPGVEAAPPISETRSSSWFTGTSGSPSPPGKRAFPTMRTPWLTPPPPWEERACS